MAVPSISQRRCRTAGAALTLAGVATLWAGGFCFTSGPSATAQRLRPGLCSRRCDGSSASGPGVFPELCVFDLDACLWDKEMFEMMAVPTPDDVVRGDLNGRGEGVVGVMSAGEKISLHKGALIGLQEHADGLYPGMRVALASSADTPYAEKVGRAALSMLEVLPGLTVEALILRDWDGKDVNQIGRQPPLSASKARSHFPRLKRATGVPYDRMLYFDDCIWDDHCGAVASACREKGGRGVLGIRTPRGLGENEWRRGLEAYAAAQASANVAA